MIFYWLLLAVMYGIALFAMYNQGCLDTLNMTLRLLRGERPSTVQHIPDWKQIVFYVAPLVVFTVVGVLLMLKGTGQ